MKEKLLEVAAEISNSGYNIETVVEEGTRLVNLMMNKQSSAAAAAVEPSTNSMVDSSCETAGTETSLLGETVETSNGNNEGSMTPSSSYVTENFPSIDMTVSLRGIIDH
jgi:hypothetical protein